MAGIDMQKLQDLIDQANDFINTMKDLQNGYAKTINEYIEDLEKIVNNSSNHSAEYVNRKREEITYKINNVFNSFNKKINDLVEQIKIWADTQQNQIKVILLKKVQALFGIQLPDEAIEKLGEAIPNFPFPEFEFKLELPDIEDLSIIDINKKISLPRIPLIEVPGYVEYIENKITDTANDINNIIADNKTKLQ